MHYQSSLAIAFLGAVLSSASVEAVRSGIQFKEVGVKSEEGKLTTHTFVPCSGRSFEVKKELNEDDLLKARKKFSTYKAHKEVLGGGTKIKRSTIKVNNLRDVYQVVEILNKSSLKPHKSLEKITIVVKNPMDEDALKKLNWLDLALSSYTFPQVGRNGVELRACSVPAGQKSQEPDHALPEQVETLETYKVKKRTAPQPPVVYVSPVHQPSAPPTYTYPNLFSAPAF